MVKSKDKAMRRENNDNYYWLTNFLQQREKLMKTFKRLNGSHWQNMRTAIKKRWLSQMKQLKAENKDTLKKCLFDSWILLPDEFSSMNYLSIQSLKLESNLLHINMFLTRIMKITSSLFKFQITINFPGSFTEAFITFFSDWIFVFN